MLVSLLPFYGMVQNGIPRVYFYFLSACQAFLIKTFPCIVVSTGGFSLLPVHSARFLTRTGGFSCHFSTFVSYVHSFNVSDLFSHIQTTFNSSERNSELCSLPRNGSERNSENLHLFWFPGTEIQVVFSSVEEFGTELWEFASIFGLRNGIPSYFLLSGRVRNGIPRFSVPRNNRNSVGNNHLFRLFRLPRNYFFVGNSQP